MQKLISVIIPTYNRENIIKECLESVLNQTYKNIEVIIVDDCSVDNTVAVAQSVSDDRVSCHKLEKNSGACFARNYGASLANGEYIAFQDSDDIWDLTKLEKQVAYLESGDYDLIFCGMKRVNELGQSFFYPPIDFVEQDSALEQILFENRISTQCILMYKHVFETVKFDPAIRRFQDWDFAINAAKHFKMGYLKDALVVSEIQENSISKNVNKFNALKVIYEKYAAEIAQSHILEARFMCKFAEAIRHSDLKQAKKYYRESLRHCFDVKILAKYILCVLKLRNFVGKS